MSDEYITAQTPSVRTQTSATDILSVADDVVLVDYTSVSSGNLIEINVETDSTGALNYSSRAYPADANGVEQAGIVVEYNSDMSIPSTYNTSMGGGGLTPAERELLALTAEHLDNTKIHITGTEHEQLKRLIAAFPVVDPDIPPVTPPTLPDEALSWSTIEAHFSKYAQPGITQSPGHVFASRVPWAREEGGTWKNNACAIDEIALGINSKLWDNADLAHECSTDTVLGADDYIGKHWAFYCNHCNYITDEYGIKHITAIEGYTLNGVVFDPNKNVGAFGPKFWYFCKTEMYQDPDTGAWLTDDGTETGTPLYQLWGISDRAWADLDESRRTELAKHGITEADFSLWPECKVYSADDVGMVDRPYWVHSAYCGGYEVQSDGTIAMVSKKNAPLYNGLSYQKLNGIYGYNAAAGGGACVNGFGMLFDIVKNATKNNQDIHYGMASNNCTAIKSTLSTGEADYVFPISSKSHFEVGCTVWIWQSTANSQHSVKTRSTACQIGRVQAIETRTLILEDGTSTESLCLVFDPTTVEPFLVRTGTNNEAAIAAAKEISDAGNYCHCFATQGMAMGGETDWVLGKHDGSVTSNTNGRHPYRVQLTEYMPGALICAADTVVVRGTGSQEVTVNGVTSIPPNTVYVILTAPPTVARISTGTLAQFLAAGYVAVGLTPAKEGYVVNERLDPLYGVAYPVSIGGSGSGSSTGHADYVYVGASPAEFLIGGYLTSGADAGSSYLRLSDGVSSAYWGFAARD